MGKNETLVARLVSIKGDQGRAAPLSKVVEDRTRRGPIDDNLGWQYVRSLTVYGLFTMQNASDKRYLRLFELLNDDNVDEIAETPFRAGSRMSRPTAEDFDDVRRHALQSLMMRA